MNCCCAVDNESPGSKSKNNYASYGQEDDQPSGTIPYMAPEYLENKNCVYTEKTEVFSFGVLMWEIFSDPKIAREGPYPNL